MHVLLIFVWIERKEFWTLDLRYFMQTRQKHENKVILKNVQAVYKDRKKQCYFLNMKSLWVLQEKWSLL